MGVDAILVGAQLVTALQSIVSRKLDPARNGVVSITEFITDGSRNVLPSSALLKGDARALSDDTNHAIEAHMRRIAAGIAAAHDVDITVTYDTIFPSLTNDASAVSHAIAAARTISDTVDPACDAKLFSEDFAHMARTIPGCFMLIGMAPTPATPARCMPAIMTLMMTSWGRALPIRQPLHSSFWPVRTLIDHLQDQETGSDHRHSDCHQCRLQST